MRITISPAIEADHAEVRSLVRRGFRGPLETTGVEVHVKGSWREQFVPDAEGGIHYFKDGRAMTGHFHKTQGGFGGNAYNGVPSISRVAKGTRYLVTITMPVRPEELSHLYPKTHQDHRAKSMPTYVINTWQDNLLNVAGHEAYHIAQYQRGLPHSEVECERHSVHVLTGQRCSHPRRRARRKAVGGVAGAGQARASTRIFTRE